MNAKSLLSLANATLYLVGCTLIGTGLLLEFRMEDEGATSWLLGIDKDGWSEAHFVIAILFICLAALHLLQNWAWIRMTLSQFKPGAMMVLGLGVGLIVALLVWPVADKPATGGKNVSHQLKHDD